MANISVDLTPTQRIFQFAGRKDPHGIRPYARLTTEVQGIAIAAKIATNTQTVTIQIRLPVNQAYVFEALYARIRITAGLIGDVDSVENYESVAELELQADGVSSTQDRFMIELLSDGAFQSEDNANSSKIWNMVNPYRNVFFNENGNVPAIDVVLEDSDVTNATLAGTMIFWATFLMYEIPQVYNVAVSTPILTRSI